MQFTTAIMDNKKEHLKLKVMATFTLTIIAAFMMMISMAIAMEGKINNGWQNQEYKVKGSWSVEQRSDGNYIVFSDDFKTRNAPDLKLFVSDRPYTTINGNNATQGAKLISKLSSSKGGQAYKIPANVHLSDFQSLIIHCEQFSKLWASTPLK
jgi:hypothetical protein